MSMCMSWLYPFKKIKGFPLKVKSLQNTATYKKNSGEGFHPLPHLPPNPLYTAVGVWICEDVKGLNFATLLELLQGTREKNWPKADRCVQVTIPEVFSKVTSSQFPSGF